MWGRSGNAPVLPDATLESYDLTSPVMVTSVWRGRMLVEKAEPDVSWQSVQWQMICAAWVDETATWVAPQRQAPESASTSAMAFKQVQPRENVRGILARDEVGLG